MDENNDQFYNIVKLIVNDVHTRKIVFRMDDNQIINVANCLNNDVLCGLQKIVKETSKKIPKNINISTEDAVSSIIQYHKLCSKEKIQILDILIVSKYVLINAIIRKLQNEKFSIPSKIEEQEIITIESYNTPSKKINSKQKINNPKKLLKKLKRRTV